MEDICKGLMIAETFIEVHVSVVGVFICVHSCFNCTQYVGLSKRFVPEAVTFLTSVLGYFSIGRQGEWAYSLCHVTSCLVGVATGIVYPPFVQKCVLKTELSKSTVCGPEVATSSSVRYPCPYVYLEACDCGGVV